MTDVARVGEDRKTMQIALLHAVASDGVAEPCFWYGVHGVTDPRGRIAHALGFGLRQLGGKHCTEAAFYLAAAVMRMEKQPSFFGALCYPDAPKSRLDDLNFLREALDLCSRWPASLIRI